MQIEIDDDLAVKITLQELMETYRIMKQDFDNFIDNNIVRGVFSFDPTEESNQLNRHLDALETILELYGVDVDDIIV